MNSKQLQYAVKLSEALNFSQVAEQLNISQPALSKQIMSLEQELGIRLFDRRTVPLSLTPAGEYFIHGAKELLYRESQLVRSVEGFKSGELGKLVIGISPFRGLYLIPDIAKKVREKYPGVQIVLHEAGSDQLRKEAAEGKFDFAIVNLPVDESTLDVTPIESDTLVLAVPKRLADTLPCAFDIMRPEIEFTDCRDLPFIVVGHGQELRQLFDKLCSAADFQPNIAAEVVGVATAWAMAQAGIGAALLPLQFVGGKRFCDDLVLFSLKNKAHTYTRQPAIVTKRGQYISEYAKYAMDLCMLRT